MTTYYPLNNRTPSLRLLLAATLLATACVGCATRPDLGTPIVRTDPTSGYRFNNLDPVRRDDDLLVVTTFSGGGARAAAFSYGVLQRLRSDTITHDGVRKPLLQEVDLISAVSGGAVTAASYALEGDALFATFEQRLLKHNLRRSLWAAALNPVNLSRLASRRFARGDLIAEVLDHRLFRGATFADLAQRSRRPYVILNATDLSGGTRFEFTQERFDALCLDLAPYPVARAVAASGAAPPAAAPITLQNAAGTCGYSMPTWAQVLPSAGAPPSRRMSLAQELAAYQQRGQMRFLHLVDGGLSDNLGVRAAIDAIARLEAERDIVGTIGAAVPRRIVFIVVDAANRPSTAIARRPHAPGELEAMRLAALVAIDRYSTESKLVLRSLLDQVVAELRRVRPIELYYIDVNPSQLADVERRDTLLAIPTTLSLPAATINTIVCSAHAILASAPDYRRLLVDLSGVAPAVPSCE